MEDKELYTQMQATELKPGRKARHRKSGKVEEIVSLIKFKKDGEWVVSVLYKGIDSNTGEMAMFGRTLSDFLENFEPVDGTILGDDLPFTSEGEPFTAKGNTRRNCKNCRNLTPVDGVNLCGLWNSVLEDLNRQCSDFSPDAE